MKHMILVAAMMTALSWDQIRVSIIQEYRQEFDVTATSKPPLKPSDCTPDNLKVFRNGVLQRAPSDYTWDAAACEVKPAVAVDQDSFVLLYN